MPCRMIGQPFPDTASLAHDAQLCTHYATAAITVKDKVVSFFFHRLPFFVSFLLCLALLDDDFRYGMQWHNKLHLCLLPFFTDIFLSVGCRLNVSKLQMFHISNSQSRKTRKDKHPSCLFCFLINYSQCHEFCNIALLQKAYLLFRFLIFNVSSTNSEQCKLCVHSPLYIINTRLLWKQTIGGNGS